MMYLRCDYAMKILVLDHFWRRGLTKNKRNFARTYPFVEILDTKLNLFDEIKRMAGWKSGESAP